ncbi:uncharacterized protein K444DRAFT_649527 [Hyaloscypha bicolor E]|uniref:Hemerythrin-like domain-containing protein n=1 Tax=Hyaloscypha bicolor E TaxID=1095630 RepID=A0A2J6TXI8_9HELO|nr:uncharacterized protein K444DRAFT_649527 [Hyaloscypha bicolor E]PMD67691.1 hypothetical protein K444DRAFT_649527 [Hyaloscypha bicolor E]
MALVHNIVLRGLNCITLQANHVKKPEDILDFMTFCDAWSCTLHSHHNTEETVYFPLLEEQSTEKGVMSRNHTEHETFLPGLLALDEYIQNVKADVKTYDGSKILKITEDLGPALEAHLTNEIDLLESLAKGEKIDWNLLGRAMAAHSKKVADRVREVPFLITNSDVTYESGIHGERFPPFPWFVHQIFRWVYIPQLKGAWRFASCDDYGMPKELPFA